MDKTISCVVVGDDGVGKTCMLLSNVQNKFPSENVPNVYDSYGQEPFKATVNAVSGLSHNHELQKSDASSIGKVYNLTLYDTVGHEDYDRLRPITYINMATWIPEVRRYRPAAPIILVGTKLDLRHPKDPAHTDAPVENQEVPDQPICVKHAEGAALCEQAGAATYVECSALTQQNLQQVFEEAAKAHISRPPLSDSEMANLGATSYTDLRVMTQGHGDQIWRLHLGPRPPSKPRSRERSCAVL